MVKIIETPRDAMQGIEEFIPTTKKIAFINALLKVGFDTLDFGSFVSPKAIPQLADTRDVVEQLEFANTKTELLAIIGNKRGAEDASQFSQIKYLGYPYSISETFLKVNINSNFEKAYHDVSEIQNICQRNQQELVVYISNAFGNIYGDDWSPEIVHEHVSKLNKIGVKIIPLSDTSGVGQEDTISNAFKAVVNEFTQIEFGAHLHTHIGNWKANVNAAFEAGCRRFDTVMNGLGGCPMTAKKLVGNLPTMDFLNYLEDRNEEHHLNMTALNEAFFLEAQTFPTR
ncbi:hydroxymethylglutaryl-CoA lyase [Lentimicrobium sp. L6]|uniref:hydroxymethylglutaryl-CoA lyase n=1 Tax=Lentimicrobium sp. L6 TaxID=2735916 RepID=UPI0015570D50|nr:hydroxymethylglutaryl-CoA lyase [Lentimicrobium sp. L6]NPD83785.1 hydroxymethylglutaryl-CoA lyase [Lentimicrobium sp. L6]